MFPNCRPLKEAPNEQITVSSDLHINSLPFIWKSMCFVENIRKKMHLELVNMVIVKGTTQMEDTGYATIRNDSVDKRLLYRN